MISSGLTFCVFLFIAGAKAQYQVPCSVIENLEDEYYTTTQTITCQVLPQDETDAQAIIDSKKDEKVIASIFSSRPKIRRYIINEQITAKSEDKKTPWIADIYVPQDRKNGKPFTDLCFGLIKDEATVLGNYLASFMTAQQHNFITIGMVLTKDMQNMISTFDTHVAPDAFKTLRKSQQPPYENMLRVWVRQNREKLETEELNCDCIKKDAQDLQTEHDGGHWHEKRDVLETVLMKKSIKHSRAVIQQFEEINDGKLIEDIIAEDVHNHGLDPDLGDVYASLARYIKYKYTYIADILRKYSDGQDFWAVWIICITVVHPYEWAKINTAFKKYKAEDCLSKFILQKITDDRILAELIATIVDPTFQPTTFEKISTPSPELTPPPVPSTTLAP